MNDRDLSALSTQRVKVKQFIQGCVTWERKFKQELKDDILTKTQQLHHLCE